MENIYSEIKFEKQPRMRIARYVIISPNPECDVMNYMDNWAEKSGLLEVADFTPRKIGWDFHCVSEEQKTQFNLRGYVYCYTLPEDFTPKCDGAEIAYIEADEYAVLRITDPFADPFARIGGGWQKVFDYVQNSEYKTKVWDNRYCFEEIIEIDGVTYMDIYIPTR